MLKSKEESRGASAATTTTSSHNNSTSTTIIDRPRKKLSFREPEIMGHMRDVVNRKKFLFGGGNSGGNSSSNQVGNTVIERNNKMFGRATFHSISEMGEDTELEV